MEFERRSKRRETGNIAPLVDIVFLLLLFFVLTYQATLERAITVDLPPSSTAAETPREAVTLSISAAGEFFLNDAQTAETALRAALIHLHERAPATELSIRADRQLDVGVLVKAVDMVRDAGFMAFSLATRE